MILNELHVICPYIYVLLCTFLNVHTFMYFLRSLLWPPHAKSWLIGKDSDVGRDWGQEEKGMTEDEMAGWHHRLDGHWVWVNSGSWWWTGRPEVLRFMGSQRVGHDWETELNWTEGLFNVFYLYKFKVSFSFLIYELFMVTSNPQSLWF